MKQFHIVNDWVICLANQRPCTYKFKNDISGNALAKAIMEPLAIAADHIEDTIRIKFRAVTIFEDNYDRHTTNYDSQLRGQICGRSIVLFTLRHTPGRAPDAS